MSTTQWGAALTMPVTEGRDHIQGPADAAATLVEYGDYECPYCGAAYPIIKEVQGRMGARLRFVFRNFPITTSHPHAEQAAEAAEAAASQARFWEMHDLLYENQRRLRDQDLHGYAGELGLDVQEFDKNLAEHVHAARVREDFMSGVRSGVNGTPVAAFDVAESATSATSATSGRKPAPDAGSRRSAVRQSPPPHDPAGPSDGRGCRRLEAPSF
jgi:protein-disulfide isomerase